MTTAPTPGHPTAAERFFFDNNGYLLLEDFLPPALLARLLAAVEQTIAHRRSPAYTRERPTAFKEQLEGRNARLFHLLDADPVFLDMLDYPPMMAYVHGLLNELPHLHSTDVIYEVEKAGHHGLGWHMDGIQSGYRNLRPHIPLLQFKVGYYLSDMSAPNQGNLTLVPGSHKGYLDPDAADLKNPALFPGAMQVCGRPGSAFIFHNGLWHTGGPWTKADGKRIVLYYGYEHPWMLACTEQWRYPKQFLAGLPPEKRKFFHGFVFDPPEYRTL